MDISGRTFVITGAGAGIGQHTALEVLRRGGRVAGIDLRSEGLDETLRLAGAENPDFGAMFSAHPIDITDRSSVLALPQAIRDEHGGIDGLINVAGIIQPFVHVTELEFTTMERILAVNFWGTVNTVKAFLPELQRRPVSSLVNVSSMGSILPVPGQTVYGASKAAVNLFTEGLFAELQGGPVRVTTVYPGAIATEISTNSGVDRTEGEEAPEFGGGGKSSDPSMTPPQEAGRLIVDAVEKGSFRVHIGKDAKAFRALSTVTPKRAIRMVAEKMKDLV
ncbi:MAG: SDR family oxidoreductase [Nesterenkonia sp.]|uniref:SDR family NAD(P)-dependent oxidoreductase n=1 Tax=Nesterenkonia marinintestina TaxID=2979865 RepID=UPI0021BE0B57|nr:SDR family oxidoreductase [Nesterenkonia sp. GX14115]MDO5492734.1 SDR family oxidoreductase [Nesterenkonia sp.]